MHSATWTCRHWDARSERSLHNETAPRPSRYGRSTANLLEGAHGRFLLGVSPAAPDSRGPHRELGNQALDLEILAVSRPVGCHHGILRQGDLPRLKQFLQKRFRVFSERLRHLMQGLLAHELRSQPRQISLGKLAEAFEQLGCNDAVENAVAQELQALVVKRAVTAVRECPR